MASSRAQLTQAQANLVQAQKSYERTAAIKKTNPQLISDEQMEQLRTTVDVNKALYESARHSVDQSTRAHSATPGARSARRRSTRRCRAA